MCARIREKACGYKHMPFLIKDSSVKYLQYYQPSNISFDES